MKKTISLFVFTLFIMTCLAQVKNEVFGVTLDSDNIEQVIRILERKGLTTYKGPNEVHVSYVRFAGEDWSKAQYDFIGGKVTSVEFSCIPGSSKASDMFVNIGNMLLKKYPQYVQKNESGYILISDDKISIELKMGQVYLTLKYMVVGKPAGYEDL